MPAAIDADRAREVGEHVPQRGADVEALRFAPRQDPGRARRSRARPTTPTTTSSRRAAPAGSAIRSPASTKTQIATDDEGDAVRERGEDLGAA